MLGKGRMEIIIRQEKTADFKAVFELIKSAFQNEPLSDSTEQFLVERLRKSSAFIPELSLVAEIGNTIVGHILLTKVNIRNSKNVFGSLALAPVSVFPEYQRKGIGWMLIEQAHQIARELSYQLTVLLGHEKYYPRFGYKQSNSYGIQLPFDVPAENCMVIELVPGGLNGVSGMVEYPKEFYE